MAVIPKVKEEQLNDISANLNSIHWIFDDETDARVIAEAYSIREDSDDGFPIYIRTNNTDCEEYTLNISTDKAEIVSEGANGAFYGLHTLKQLLKENDGLVACRTINDAPDMKYRGFYHDVTRGKVPTLETLKSLVDTMAEYKLNSLQLYIEHTFELKEYEHCREKLGYLTKAEIRELEQYCKLKFIEIIPSNIASEYGEYNIQCNGIGPGYIATPQTAPLREIQPDGSRHPFDQFIISKTPAARWGTPEDLAGPAIFLASDASDFVNGHVLYVDGGILAYIGKQP